jgi:hypothetical protein
MDTLSVYAAEVAAFPKARLSENEQDIARLLEIPGTPGHWRPDALTLDPEISDKLLDGEALTEKEEIAVFWTEWVSGFLDAMTWWGEVSWAPLKELVSRHSDECDIERRLQEIAVLEGGVFLALARARTEHFKDLVPGFEGHSAEPGTRELAKRYRLYTRYVEALLVEVWPDLNRELLINP